MSYTLIVPTVAESTITGFRLGAKKSIYKQEWEIRIIQTAETKAVITKNGNEISLEDAGKQKGFIKFWNDFVKFYNQSAKV